MALALGKPNEPKLSENKKNFRKGKNKKTGLNGNSILSYIGKCRWQTRWPVEKINLNRDHIQLEHLTL